MKKAVQLANSFSSFINLCQMYCNKKIEIPKLNINEIEVFSKLNDSSNKIHQALCDDFNTCLVVEELFELTNYMNKKFQTILDPNLISEQQVKQPNDLNFHYGCIMSVRNYIERKLNLFGIKITERNNQSVESQFKLDGLIDVSLNFRNQVRNLALNKETELNPDVKNILLQYCDQFRDALRKENIEFKVIFFIKNFCLILSLISNNFIRTLKERLVGNL